jgi:hypothetical protein
LVAAVHGICSLVIDRQLTAKGFEPDPHTLADTVLANVFLGLRAPTAMTEGLGRRVRRRPADAGDVEIEPPPRRERPRSPKLPD